MSLIKTVKWPRMCVNCQHSTLVDWSNMQCGNEKLLVLLPNTRSKCPAKDYEPVNVDNVCRFWEPEEETKKWN